MARQNYSFEKRLKEQAKEQKKREKLEKRASKGKGNDASGEEQEGVAPAGGESDPVPNEG